MASVITESDVRESMFFIGELVVDERNGLVAKVAADPDENGLILIEYCNPLFDMEDDMVQAREISSKGFQMSGTFKNTNWQNLRAANFQHIFPVNKFFSPKFNYFSSNSMSNGAKIPKTLWRIRIYLSCRIK